MEAVLRADRVEVIQEAVHLVLHLEVVAREVVVEDSYWH